MDALMQDIRFGLRIWLKKPGFTVVAILTLTLGVAATMMVFSVVNAGLIRDLPYRNPERLTFIRQNLLNPELTKSTLSPLEYYNLKDQPRSFEQVGAYQYAGTNLTGAGEPERFRVGLASASLFPVGGRRGDPAGCARGNRLVQAFCPIPPITSTER